MGGAVRSGFMAGALAQPQPGGAYSVIVRGEALKPRERPGAFAPDHIPEPAPQPDEQTDEAEDNKEFPQQRQNGYYYFCKHGFVTLVSVLQI